MCLWVLIFLKTKVSIFSYTPLHDYYLTSFHQLSRSTWGDAYFLSAWRRKSWYARSYQNFLSWTYRHSQWANSRFYGSYSRKIDWKSWCSSCYTMTWRYQYDDLSGLCATLRNTYPSHHWTKTSQKVQTRSFPSYRCCEHDETDNKVYHFTHRCI